MANYTPTFTKPYPSGWADKPSKTTPVTAAIMNSYDTAIVALEAYLRDNAIDTVSVSLEQFPSDGREWLGTITVGNNQYRIYMPSLKYENSVSGGIKIGTITLGEQSFDVYAPASSAGGSTVSVVPKTLTGTNIAEITVDGTTYQLYAPTGGSGSGSTVTAEATLTEGTQIGKITIDGTEIILYAPTITVDSELSETSTNPVQNKVVNAALENKMDKSLESLAKYELGKTGTLTFTTTEEMTELIASYASIMNNNFTLAFNSILMCTQFKNYLSTSNIDCDLLTDYKAIYFVNGSAETNNLPTGFGGGILLNSTAGSTSAANYQYVIDFTNGKQYFRKYYQGAWTDWQETNSGITIDSALSDTSVNPVQNKIITAKLNEVFQSVSEGKNKIAAAITDKGITTAADATFQVMADNIGKISVSSGEVSGNNFRTGISMNVILNFQEVTWNVTTDPNPSVSASFGEAIVTNWNGGSNIGVNIFTVYPIDLTNIKSIKIKYTESAHYGDTFPFWLGITSTKYMTVVDPRNIVFDKKVSNIATGETEITMDVSDISGKKYIYIMPIGYTCTITDLILEKEVDTRFEIAEPKLDGTAYLTLLYNQAGYGYYATKRAEQAEKYWAIGVITYCGVYTVPLIVSDVSDYACVTSTYMGNRPTSTYTFEYDGKTYYCNSNVQGANTSSLAISNESIPLYDVHDTKYTDNEAGCVYMAKKLLDFYYGKEEFPT